ncbi:ATP synthase, H+ transporting, mitochondrial F1 complex, delta subunit, isoform CRA_d, partial [Rattus norvegicus]
MLPAALLRHPGLRRLVLQARTYAQAAASPAPAAGPGQMSFTFASPTQVFFDGANVRQVDVPTLTGAFGILASHVPTLQVLRPGLVVVHAEDGTTTKYFVSSGSVTVNADSSVQLLAEEVSPPGGSSAPVTGLKLPWCCLPGHGGLPQASRVWDPQDASGELALIAPQSHPDSQLAQPICIKYQEPTECSV